VESLLATPCLDRIRNQKIMVVLGEDRNGVIVAGEALYNPHLEAINQRLKAVGLQTYAPGEIRRQIAQAEMEALLRNDVRAARAAAQRLAARYILRGLVTTRASRNAVVNVNQVSVNMNFVLTGADGALISQVSEKNESFAGRDVAGMALTLINERADELVAQLYSDYCQGAAGR
jgi:NAD(P)H-hydrate repair Nnr-like enzyme with NAD(P)H-hydrate dehydratase domain